MYYLLFDTETTGLPSTNYKEYWDKENTKTCRLVQLAYVICDEHQEVIQQENIIIKPKDFEITNSHLHGITQEMAEEKGQEIEQVMTMFVNFIKKYEPTLIAHNLNFDTFIINAELSRMDDQKKDVEEFETLEEIAPKTYCTMLESTDVVQIGWNDYHQSYKWPKLYELADFLQEEGYKIEYDSEGLHQAQNDTDLLRQCFFAFKDLQEQITKH